MKIRTSPVSNSSSSSFIIGIAKISKKDLDTIVSNMTPEEQVRYGAYDTINGLQVYDKNRLEKELEDRWGDIKKSGNCIVIESFNGDEVGVDISNMNKDDYILVLSESGGGDDSDFWDEESEEYNYDIDESFFDSDTISSARYLVSLGGDYTYGAGRNG